VSEHNHHWIACSIPLGHPRQKEANAALCEQCGRVYVSDSVRGFDRAIAVMRANGREPAFDGQGAEFLSGLDKDAA
jgi:hypothetical protein